MGDTLRRYRLPVLAWAAVGLVLVLVGHVSQQLHANDAVSWDLLPVRSFMGGWVQFDGWEYLHIADDGYWYQAGARAPVVFFPLYPLLVRGLGLVSGADTVVAGLVVSAAAGLAAVVLFWRWLADQAMAGAAQATALAVLLLYPFGWYLYGVVYADALFLALVLGAFVAATRRHYLLAGLVGALATATRPTGLALVPGLLLVVLTEAQVLRVPDRASGLVARWQLPVRFDRSKARPAMAGPLLAFGGIVAYAGYLGWRFGDPLIFATDQSQYQGSGIKTILKAGLVYDLIHWDDPIYTASALAQAVLVVAMLGAVPAVGRRFGWGYGLYVLALVVIPTLISRDYLGAGRYLIAAFPVFALVGEWLADRPRARLAWLSGSALALVILTAGFAQSRMLT